MLEGVIILSIKVKLKGCFTVDEFIIEENINQK